MKLCNFIISMIIISYPCYIIREFILCILHCMLTPILVMDRYFLLSLSLRLPLSFSYPVRLFVVQFVYQIYYTREPIALQALFQALPSRIFSKSLSLIVSCSFQKVGASRSSTPLNLHPVRIQNKVYRG